MQAPARSHCASDAFVASTASPTLTGTVPQVFEAADHPTAFFHPPRVISRRDGLRTLPPAVDPMAADGDGRRIPFVSIPRHTLILLARASAQYSLPRPRNGNFAHASRSDSPRNLLELQPLYPAQPSALVLYCSDFMLTLSHTGRSLDLYYLLIISTI